MRCFAPAFRRLDACDWQEFAAFTAYYAEALSAAQDLAEILSGGSGASPASDPDHDVLLRVARLIAAAPECGRLNSDGQRKELAALGSACTALHRVGRDPLVVAALKEDEPQGRPRLAWRLHGHAARELAIRLLAIRRIVLLVRETR